MDFHPAPNFSINGRVFADYRSLSSNAAGKNFSVSAYVRMIADAARRNKKRRRPIQRFRLQ